MNAFRRYLAGRSTEPPHEGSPAAAASTGPAVAEGDEGGGASSPGSVGLEKSHSTAASGEPFCSKKQSQDRRVQIE